MMNTINSHFFNLCTYVNLLICHVIGVLLLVCFGVNTLSAQCNSQGNNSNEEYISNVSLANINNSSGAAGYTDFKSISTDLARGTQYTISVTPTWTGNLYNEGYSVWIDYNGNNDFTDAGEQIGTVSPTLTTPVSMTFTVPSGANLASVVMRVSMKYNGIPTSCETFQYGEVEDYTINIVDEPVVTCISECSAPYEFNWYNSSTGTGVQWPITNGEATLTRIYPITGPLGTYNVSVTLDNPDGQNIDLTNCGTNPYAYTATCDDPSGNVDCDNNPMTPSSQFSYGCDYMTFGMTSQNSSNSVSITYSFEVPTIFCQFEIGDIDFDGRNSDLAVGYQDEVTVVADSVGIPVTIYAESGSSVSISNNFTSNLKLLANYISGVSGDLTPDDPAGHAFISSSSKITSITFIYTNGPEDDGISNDHAIRLDGFQFCPDPLPVCDSNPVVSASQTICEGNSFNNLTASGAITYQWQTSTNNSTWSDIAGAISASYNPPETIGTRYYRVQGTTSICTEPSESVTLIVNSSPTANAGSDESICFGSSTSLTASGGVSYAWSNSAGNSSSVTVSPTTTTTYTVTVTASNGCIDTDQVTVTVIPLPTANMGSIPNICEGSVRTYQASNAGDGATYSWNFGINATPTSATGIGPHDVTYINTNTNGAHLSNTATLSVSKDGCTAQDVNTFSILKLPQITVSSNSISCGIDDGSITFTFPDNPNRTKVEFSTSGGTSYLPNVDDNIGSYTISNLSSGVYDLYVRWGDNSCPVDLPDVTFEDNTLPTANAGGDDDICSGSSTTLTASGGASYAWSNSAGNTSSVTVSPLVTTTYTVTVTASNGCTDTDQVTITVNELPVVSSSNDGPLTCAQTSVTLTASPTGLSYAWSGGGSGETKTVSTAGTYTVTITDGNGCTSVTSTVVGEDITDPTANAGGDDDICSGSSTTLTASGGVSYAWSNSAGNTSSVTVSPLLTTTYTVTVTASNGCTDTDQVTITVNELPVVSSSNNGPLTCAQTSVTLTANPTGMSYAWSGGGSGQTKTVTTAGTYTVTVTDGNGCTAVTSTIVGEDITDPTADAGGDDDICSGSSTTLTASGGVSYAWSNSAGNTASVTVSPLLTTTYTVTVTASNGCTDTDQVQVIVTPLPIANMGSTPNICEGTVRSFLASDAGLGSSYVWDFGTIATPSSATGIGPHDVMYTNTNSNGAHLSNSVTLTVTKDGCTAQAINTFNVLKLPQVTVTNNSISCGIDDGEITFSFPNNPDRTNIEFSINGGSSFDYYVSDAIGSYTVTSLSSGTYDLNVRWGNDSCPVNLSDVTFTDNTLPLVGAGGDESICNGESITLTATGGGSYAWSNSAGNTASVAVSPTVTTTYTVTVTASNGCTDTDDVTITVNDLPVAGAINNGPLTCAQTSVILTATPSGMSYAWSDGGSSVTKTVTTAGTYTVTVTDGNGCTDVASTTVGEDITDPVAGAGGDESICNGESITLTATGGGSYAWSNSAGNTASVAVSPTVTTTYTVTVTASNGCTDTDDVTITVNDLPVAGAINNGPLTCAQTSVILTASPSGMSYAWSGGGSGVTKTVTTAGTYTVTVTDGNGCTAVASTIVGEDITLPTANAGGDDDICSGSSTTLTASGGVSYAWSNSAGNSSSVTVSPTTTTTYTVTLTGSNGCTDTDQVTVTVNSNPIAGASNNGPITCAQPNVLLTATPSGMSYLWDDNSTGETRTVSTPGTYTVTVTDGNGCSDVASTTVGEDATAPTAEAGSDESICFGSSTSLTASGGVSYAWSNSAGNTASVTVSPLVTTTYTVTVTASNGCTDTDQVTITVNDLPVPICQYEVSGGSIIQGDCDVDVCEGDSLILSVDPNFMASYDWTGPNGFTGSGNNLGRILVSGSITTSYTGTYTVVITDSNGCTAENVMTVNVNQAPAASATNDGPLTCSQTSVVMTATPSGLSYAWSGGGTNETKTVTAPGIYTVTVTDGNGCSSITTTEVTEDLSEPLADAGDDAVSCDGDPVILSASGGVSYLWSDGAGSSSTVVVNPATTTTYTVTVTGANGCTATDEVLVTVSPDMSTSIDYNGSQCLADDTEISAVTTGGIQPFSYSWTGPDGFTADTETIGIDTNGNYYVTVTDAYGCDAETSGFIYQSYNPTIVNLGTGVCEGEGVTLSLNNSGTTAYQWGANAGNSTNPSVFVYPNPPSTTYMVTVTNDNGCTGVAMAEIDVEPRPEVSFELDSIMCVGETANVIPGGTGDWSSNSNSVAIVTDAGQVTAVGPGTAQLTYEDATTGCTSLPLTVTVVANPAVAASDDITICNGEEITLSATATGAGTISYEWDNGIGVGAAHTFIPVGSNLVRTVRDYNVIVTDENGCTDEEPVEVTIFSNPAPTVTKTDETCEGDNGSITFNINNHLNRSTLKLSINDGVNWLEVADNIGAYTFSNLDAGDYILKTSWGNDECEYNLGTINIKEGFLPSISASSDNGACGTTGEGLITFTVGDIVDQDSLMLSIDGGITYPYTIGDNVGNYTLTNLGVGNYNLYSKWNDGSCILDLGIESIVSAQYPVAEVTNDTMTCEGEILILTAGGGSSYLWDNGSTDQSIAVYPSANTTYTVTVSTEAGCTNIASTHVEVSSDLDLSIDFNGSQCLGSGGTISAVPVDGLAPYTYEWQIPNGTTLTSQDIAPTMNGSYFVTVTDKAGCEASTSGYIYEDFDVFILNLQTEVCEGETVSISASASAALSYQWSSSVDDTLSSVSVVPAVPMSTYYVTVTNNNGCTAVASAEINVLETQDISLSGDSIICVGETTNVLPNIGGFWSSSDPNIADVNYAGLVIGKAEGVAFMTYLDGSNGCTSIESIPIYVNGLPEPSFEGSNQLCVGDTTQLLPKVGGTWTSTQPSVATITDGGVVSAVGSGIAYFVYTDTTTSCSSTTDLALFVNDLPTIMVPTYDSLCVGEQSIASPTTGGLWMSSDTSIATITDAGQITAVRPGNVSFKFTRLNTGCSSQWSDSLHVHDIPTAIISGIDTLCIGEQTVVSSDKVGSWDSENPAIATVTNGGLVTAVSPGTVRFIFTEFGTGCISAYTSELFIHPNPSIITNGPTTICIGSTKTYASSGPGEWSTSNENVATIDENGILTGVSPGNVFITYISDATGCTKTTNLPLSVVSPPDIDLSGVDKLCVGNTTMLQPSNGGYWSGDNDGVATISLSGNVTAVSEGTVTFTFTETSTNCEASNSLTIEVEALPIASIDGDATLCIGEQTELLPNEIGGWISSNTDVATVDNDGVITAVGQGIARFTFVSESGCISNQTNPVIVYPDPEPVLSDGSTCIGGVLTILPNTNGTWISSDSQIASITNSGVITGLSAGAVTFMFTDTITGCVSSPSSIVTIEAGPSINIVGDSILCIGDVSVIAPTVGGFWASSDSDIATVDNNGNITAVSAGTVRFVYTDGNTLCQSEQSSEFVINPRPVVSYTEGSELCLGDTTMLTTPNTGFWESNNPSVATVSNTGEVIALTDGVASFTFTDNLTGCSSLLTPPLVVNPVPEISFVGDNTVCIGGTINASPNSGGIWESSDTTIATVNNAGEIFGKIPGTISLTYTDSSTGCKSDGLLEATVISPTPVSITGPTAICIGSETTLSPTVGGIWTSSNPTIASVSNDGVVRGKAPGKVTFEFLDGATGCTLGSITDTISVSSCINHDFNVTTTSITLMSNINTNDNVPVGTTYSSAAIQVFKPVSAIASLTINTDGSYSFTANIPGVYQYNVPVCMPPAGSGCINSILEITVLENITGTNNPVSNLESVMTLADEDPLQAGDEVVIPTLANDACVVTTGCVLSNTVSITDGPSNGSTVIDANGNINYTPNPGFIGFDTLTYQICVDGELTNCSEATQIVTVGGHDTDNSVYASDNFIWTMVDTPVDVDLTTNVGDPDGDQATVSTIGNSSSLQTVDGGQYYIDGSGTLFFYPDPGFVGYTEIIYTVCDNNTTQACTEATAHVLVFADILVKMKVYLEGSLMENNEAKTSGGLPLMRDDLRVNPYNGKNYIPLVNPYKVAGNPFLDYTGSYVNVGPDTLPENNIITDSLGVFSVTGRDAIVDWIHVELRSKDDATEVIASRAGLLQRDGDIVDLDGVSDLRFQGVNVDQFYVKVKHRNHLGVMSNLISAGAIIDFTDINTPVWNFKESLSPMPDYTGLSTKNDVKDGYRALWAGDFDGNGLIKYNGQSSDLLVLFYEVLLHPSNTEQKLNFDFGYGYFNGDMDMNGKIKYDNPNDDKNTLFFQILLYPHNTSYSSIYDFIIQQIP